ncbi:TPA_asm: spanin [Porphyromonas phage phage018a_AFR5B1]|uniref:Spanin n=1 Tax=Porphyromonas phage phage018a_AFR5B1 TaxID=3154108 RepID=A0AAT9JDR8_9CAUD|nr:hypothetical protein PGIN_AFR-5B1_00136 [Porphyromonas gingivalis]
MKRTRCNRPAICYFVAVLIAMSAALLQIGCRVKSKYSHSIDAQRTETVISDAARAETAVQKTNVQRSTTSTAAATVEAWLSGSVDLELVTKQYERDGLGSYLAAESILKRKEHNELGHRSELTMSIIDSVLQVRIDSALSAERTRVQLSAQSQLKSKESASRRASGFPFDFVLSCFVAIFLLSLFARLLRGILPKLYNKLCSKKKM